MVPVGVETRTSVRPYYRFGNSPVGADDGQMTDVLGGTRNSDSICRGADAIQDPLGKTSGMSHWHVSNTPTPARRWYWPSKAATSENQHDKPNT